MAERPIIVNESGGGGMGMGVVLGAILVLVLGLGVAWFVMSGQFTANPTINVDVPAVTIQVPDVKVPDTVTIATPAGSGP